QSKVLDRSWHVLLLATTHEPPRSSSIPVLALGSCRAGPARTSHGAWIAANPSGHASPPGGRATRGHLVAPNESARSRKDTPFRPSPAARTPFRYAPLRASCGVRSKTVRERYR